MLWVMWVPAARVTPVVTSSEGLDTLVPGTRHRVYTLRLRRGKRMPLIATSKLQAHNFSIQIKVLCLSFSAMPPQQSFVCMCCSRERQTDLQD